MEPWYKVAQPRSEVREGRSFNPNEFAIALAQVVSGRGPEDYRDPQKLSCNRNRRPQGIPWRDHRVACGGGGARRVAGGSAAGSRRNRPD